MLFPTLLLQLVCIISVGGKLACWESQEFEIEESCRLCTNNDQPEICQLSGFIEKVKCTGGQVEGRACAKLPTYQTQLFWKFEFFVFVIGSLSAYYTFCRMKLLDNEHDERIKKQLSSL